MVGIVKPELATFICNAKAQFEASTTSDHTSKFEEAWRRIRDDRRLTRARKKLAGAELRLILQHAADAFQDGKPLPPPPGGA